MIDDEYSLSGTEHLLRLTIVALFWIEFCLSSWLSLRQVQKITHQRDEIPPALANFIYDIHDFQRSGSYTKHALLFSIVKKIYLTICWTLLIISNGIYYGWTLSQNLNSELDFLPDFVDPTIRSNAFFGFLCAIIKHVVMFPSSMYNMLYLEKKYGFYNGSRKHWIRAYLRASLFETLKMAVVMGGVTWLAQTLDYLFLTGNWALLTLFALLFWLLFPAFCVANSLAGRKVVKPLPDGELKVRIEALAERVNFPKECVFITSTFTGTTHSNAFYFGFLNYNRLVIFSTVVEGFQNVPNGIGLNPSLVEAVVAHELGHYKLFHSLFSNTIAQLEILVIGLTSLWLKRYEIIFRAFGFPKSVSFKELDEAILPGLIIACLFIIRFPLFVLNKVFNLTSQDREYKADEFATGLGYGLKLQKALVKIAIDNCIYPDADKFYSIFCLSHPTMVQRIMNINAYSRPVQK